MEELMKIEHLYKKFEDGFEVLKDINLNIMRGDIYGVLGLSGAGKSTLVRCMNGLETFDKGKIYFKGKEAVFDSETRRKITMIFQSFNLLQQRTVLKNVELAGELAKDQNTHKKAIDLLKRVGLEGKLNSYPAELSGGQQQRVAIARALMTEPDILLCDEATSALDSDTTNSILDLLKTLNKDLGLTIVIIAHQMSVIEAICNKVAIIDKSNIVEDGYIQDVFLTPKTDIAKKLIYSGKIQLSSKKRLVKLIFDGKVDFPLVTGIVKDCDILISVVYAESKKVAGKRYGQTIIELPNYDDDIEKLRNYLNSHNVRYEEISK